MALSPLDLQTLFIKMNDVNRVQAHLKGAAAQEQAFEAKALVEKEVQRDNSVNPSAEEGDKDNRIKDQREHREEQEQKKRKKSEDEADETEEKEYIKDSNLGQNIDLIG